jgi:3-oxoacyl-[acyl-carrier-protein] synthase-3
VHEQLKLPGTTPILPINNEFNNFTTAIMLANGLMLSGSSGNALIVCAGNWSRHVDYHTPESVSAGDGAGAMVLGTVSGAGKWVLVDNATGVWSSNFGAMFMAGAPVTSDYDCATNPHHCTFTAPFFSISAAGREEYAGFGKTGVPEVVRALMKKNGLTGKDIALVTHQSSSVLLDWWKCKIKPSTYVETIQQFGNMCIANLPVNLAYGLEGIVEDHLVVCGIGVEGQVNAVLFQRSGN